MSRRHVALPLILAAAFMASDRSTATAAAILPGFDANTLTRNDDLSTGLVNIGFSVNFYGLDRTQLYVNNNGNVTFDSALGTFTPFALTTTDRQIIAPFFADVDTRLPHGGDPVRYGTGTVGGRDAFGVNWVNVGYFNATSQPQVNRNAFQLVMIDRSDVGAGDFDFWFNYNQIQWETGQASGSDVHGRGGNCARVGWANGLVTSFELPGSAVCGAFLDSGVPAVTPGPNALIFNSLNSDVDGRYIFQVRNGAVVPGPGPSPVPEPTTLVIVGLGLAGFALRRRQ
jgi:hypothetical protein